METKDGNILIAQFMGMRKGVAQYHSKSDGTYECWYDDTGKLADKRQPFGGYMLRYHSSWDWLMPVLEKTRTAGGLHCTFDIETTFANTVCSIYEKSGSEADGSADWERLVQEWHADTRTAVWLAVVAFIKYFNKQPEPVTPSSIEGLKDK